MPAKTRAHPTPADCGRASLQRVLFIHERLGNGHHATAASLAAALETSTRTIKRDIEFMRDRLGAPIAWASATAVRDGIAAMRPSSSRMNNEAKAAQSCSKLAR